MENQQRVLRLPAPAPGAGENFVVITVGGTAYGVALGEVHGLFADRRIVPLPGASPEFVGMASLRGGIVAVYSLGILLGCPPVTAPLNWLILAGGAQPFAVAFDGFETYARASGVCVMERAGHLRGSVLIGGSQRPVICLRSIAAAIAVLA